MTPQASAARILLPSIPQMGVVACVCQLVSYSSQRPAESVLPWSAHPNKRPSSTGSMLSWDYLSALGTAFGPAKPMNRRSTPRTGGAPCSAATAVTLWDQGQWDTNTVPQGVFLKAHFPGPHTNIHI